MCRSDDRNGSERIENEEIFIPRHDEVGPAVDGEFEKHVILTITARLNSVRDGNHFRHANQDAEKLLPFRDADISIEFRTRQDIGKFIQDGLGNQ